MITSVDTNVLFDVFRTRSPYHSQSREWLLTAYDRGAIVVCDVVYAELVPMFQARSTLDGALSAIGATLSPINSSIAFEAGLRWKQYRDAGGSRERILADFLICAHAVIAADAFLTRDRGFFTTYFSELSHTNPGLSTP